MKKIFTFLLFFTLLKIAVAGVTVTIKTYDVYGENVEGAIVKLGDLTDTTGIEGTAVFAGTETGWFDLKITKPGFLPYFSEVYVETEDLTVNCYLTPALSIKLTVVDETLSPLTNVTAVIKNYNEVELLKDTTDINGVVQSSKIFGPYNSYTCVLSAEGFADTTFMIYTAGNDLEAEPVVMKKGYDLSFSVNGNSVSLQGALVTLNGKTLETGETGMAVFQKKVNGVYTYLVTKPGFVDVQDTVTVQGANKSKQVVMNTGYDVTFRVFNGNSGTTGLAGDTITINGITKITGEDGLVTFGVEKSSAISFINKKAGFIDVPVEMAEVTGNTTLDILMIPDYTVVIRVFDANSWNPISGVNVNFNGLAGISDESGNVVYSHVQPSDSVYKYTVTGTGLYSNVEGTIELPYTSNGDLLSTNNQATVYAAMSSPGVYIGLANGFMSFLGSAIITFDGVDYDYDAGLGGNLFPCTLGTHTYVVTPLDESKAILKGTVEVANPEVLPVYLDVVDGRKVEFYVVNSNQEPIEGAVFTFNGEVVNTDDSGLAGFYRMPAGEYNYSVAAGGYNNVGETAVSVSVNDILELITLTSGYKITFRVNSHNEPVPGAGITIGNQTVVTGETGEAEFNEMPAGDYNYSVSKNGFNTASGVVSVADSGKTVEVYLVITTVNDLEKDDVSVYPNPASDVVFVDLKNIADQRGVEISVLNVTGSVMLTNRTTGGETRVKLDLSDLVRGIYFIRVKGISFEKSYKILRD